MALKSGLNFKLVWGLLMIVIYFCMSYLLVFTNVFVNVNMTLRIILSVVFLIYGAVRAYTLWNNR